MQLSYLLFARLLGQSYLFIGAGGVSKRPAHPLAEN